MSIMPKHKKITGHPFVDISGFNPYVTKRGVIVLERMGLLKSDIDSKWLKRGEFAEKIILYCYERDKHKWLDDFQPFYYAIKINIFKKYIQ